MDNFLDAERLIKNFIEKTDSFTFEELMGRLSVDEKHVLKILQHMMDEKLITMRWVAAKRRLCFVKPDLKN